MYEDILLGESLIGTERIDPLPQVTFIHLALFQQNSM